MIVDIHTHIFPPEFVAHRERLAAHDPAFGAIYGHPNAAMATAEDLLTSMHDATIDVSVACGFWWSDPALAAEHTDYLLAVADRSDGAILAFTPAAGPPASLTAAPAQPSTHGSVRAAGIGEVREETADLVPDVDLPLLVHCSEEVGHTYPGKLGGLTPGELWRLIEARPHARVIAAHWGGGFPFYGLMPEVRSVIDSGRLIFDTAASRYLYRPEVFTQALGLVGVEAVAWGSDFPLRPQATDLSEVRAALPDAATQALVLGGNAARFLQLRVQA